MRFSIDLSWRRRALRGGSRGRLRNRGDGRVESGGGIVGRWRSRRGLDELRLGGLWFGGRARSKWLKLLMALILVLVSIIYLKKSL